MLRGISRGEKVVFHVKFNVIIYFIVLCDLISKRIDI